MFNHYSMLNFNIYIFVRSQYGTDHDLVGDKGNQPSSGQSYFPKKMRNVVHHIIRLISVIPGKMYVANVPQNRV